MHASSFIMMTIRRLSIGSGYKYLLKSIAVGDSPEGADKSDLVRYYSETGTPPGVFFGAGLVGLDDGRGVAIGQSVTAENLQRMLQDCADPITGEVLGRVPGARAVGGFDLTFSPSKSVSVAWALAAAPSARVALMATIRVLSIRVSLDGRPRRRPSADHAY